MTETDYVMIKPVHAPPAQDTSQLSIAFPFGYIVPTYPTIVHIMRRWYPESRGPLTDIPGSGPAPALMRVEEWKKVTPEWEKITAEIEADAEAKEKLGWVREMYAFSLACALKGVKLKLDLPPKSPLMVQPPADHVTGDAAFLHYTWSTLFIDKDTQEEVWRFEKRDFTQPEDAKALKPFPMPPPFEAEKWTLQDKVPIDKDLYDITVLMMKSINTAIEYVHSHE